MEKKETNILVDKMIKKMVIVSKRKVDKNFIKSIEEFGFKYTESNPDIVLSLGGDGTYLRSERKFPGVPKLLIRDSRICEKCDVDVFEKNVLQKVRDKEYEIEENLKLEAIVKGKKFVCTNDFIIRNKIQTHALRFQVEIDEKRVNGILIGDGVVIATPFGSTGYFQSITGKPFKKGIGIAFNNLTKRVRHRVIDEGSRIVVKIVRDSAVFSSDNDPEMVDLVENDVVEVRKSEEVARIVRLLKSNDNRKI